MFDNTESICSWAEAEAEAVCEYQRVEFTVRAILLISVLIACATAPINMLVDFLFQDIISAPTADEYKVDLESRQLRQRLGRRMSAVAANARGAIRNSISIASNRITPILPVARRTLSARLSTRVSSTFTVPEATTRQLPPSVVRSYASTSMMLKNVFERQESGASNTRQSIIAPVRMSVLLATHTNEEDGENESSVYDSVERGDMRDDDAASVDSFYAMIHKQCEHLTGQAKKEFQERWGFDSGYNSFANNDSNIFGSDDDVATTLSIIKIRRKLCCNKEVKTRKHVLSGAIEEASQASTEKISKLKLASDMHVGLEIMHLFIIDLLG